MPHRDVVFFRLSYTVSRTRRGFGRQSCFKVREPMHYGDFRRFTAVGCVFLTCLAAMSCDSTSSTGPTASNSGSSTKPAASANDAARGIDLLQRIELPRDQIQGDCQLSDGAIVISGEQAAYLELPVDVPERYMLEMRVQRLQGDGSLNVGLVVGPSQVMAVLDGWRTRENGLSLVEGKPGNQNRTRTSRRIFEPGEKVLVRCVVSPQEVTVECDAYPAIQWRGDPQELSLDTRNFPPRTPRRLMIGGWGGKLRVSEGRLIEMSP